MGMGFFNVGDVKLVFENCQIEVVIQRNPSLGLGFAKTQKFGFLPKLFFNQNPNRNPSF